MGLCFGIPEGLRPRTRPARPGRVFFIPRALPGRALRAGRGGRRFAALRAAEEGGIVASSQCCQLPVTSFRLGLATGNRQQSHSGNIASGSGGQSGRRDGSRYRSWPIPPCVIFMQIASSEANDCMKLAHGAIAAQCVIRGGFALLRGGLALIRGGSALLRTALDGVRRCFSRQVREIREDISPSLCGRRFPFSAACGILPPVSRILRVSRTSP